MCIIRSCKTSISRVARRSTLPSAPGGLHGWRVPTDRSTVAPNRPAGADCILEQLYYQYDSTLGTPYLRNSSKDGPKRERGCVQAQPGPLRWPFPREGVFHVPLKCTGAAIIPAFRRLRAPGHSCIHRCMNALRSCNCVLCDGTQGILSGSPPPRPRVHYWPRSSVSGKQARRCT